ncbi:S-layer homology domain-containing protein [Thermoanaerobacterium thermosaccharolyticum]|uniref:S-layer homology domain-containing protein n=1 Tax=Thermoanaerobacterium thermosaccharolyticum TaxID=1517 RepID=UPI003DA9ED88
MKLYKKLILVVIITSIVINLSFVNTLYAASFSDIKQDAPYAEAVSYLADLNITQGIGGGLFGVGKPVTRAMMTVFINRLTGYSSSAEKLKITPSAFKDVPKNYWALGDINLATQLGFAHGVGNNLFNPEGNVTYIQALGFILNALNYKNLKWPDGVLQRADELGLTKDMSYKPDDVITRENLAVIMYRALFLKLQ